MTPLCNVSTSVNAPPRLGLKKSIDDNGQRFLQSIPDLHDRMLKFVAESTILLRVDLQQILKTARFMMNRGPEKRVKMAWMKTKTTIYNELKEC